MITDTKNLIKQYPLLFRYILWIYAAVVVHLLVGFDEVADDLSLSISFYLFTFPSAILLIACFIYEHKNYNTLYRDNRHSICADSMQYKICYVLDRIIALVLTAVLSLLIFAGVVNLIL